MKEQTVFIIDDDPSACRGITRLVRAAGIKAESFSSAKDFLATRKCDESGCIILDVRMPEMTGPELQEKLTKADYCLPIIFISAYGDVPMVAKAMKKGAVDFLTKPVDRDELLEAIRLSLAKDAEKCAARAESNSISEYINKLTPREYEIMTYVITGMLNKQIAYELKISEETVKIHRGRIFRKLKIDSVAELVRFCDKAGIAPVKPNK